MTMTQMTDGHQDAHPMLALLEAHEDDGTFVRGDVVEGRIALVSPNEVLIDVGGKSEGVLWPKEFGRMSKDEVAALDVGTSVECLILNPNDRDGNLVVSMAQARIGQDWDDSEKLHEDGTVFKKEVNGHNRGGLIVYIGQVRGFVPASQIDRRHGFKREQIDGSPDSPLASLVGQELSFKVIEMDRRGNRLILSELAAMRERRKASKSQLLDELAEGQIKKGVVTSLADFGAFVDIGGADGLVHLSELSWGRVNHPSEMLELGQEVHVKVINIDHDRKRIGLSLRALQPEPWSTVEERFVVGEVVPAEITRLADFGAFARLDDEIEGLIHVTELSDLSVAPAEVVQPGQQIQVRIIRIDPERKRIGLSLKRADSAYDDLLDDLDFEDIEDDITESVEDAISKSVDDAVSEPVEAEVSESVEDTKSESDGTTTAALDSVTDDVADGVTDEATAETEEQPEPEAV